MKYRVIDRRGKIFVIDKKDYESVELIKGKKYDFPTDYIIILNHDYNFMYGLLEVILK